MSLDEILFDDNNLDIILTEAEDEPQYMTIYKNGKEITAEVLTVTEIDGKEYALCSYDSFTDDGECTEFFYVLQNSMGYDYLEEISNPIDDYKTTKWLIDTMEEDGQSAEDIIGKGKATMPSKVSVDKYLKNALQGNVDSMYILGRYFYENRKDYGDYPALSYYWLKKADEKGHEIAFITLNRLITTDMTMVTNYEAWNHLRESYTIEYKHDHLTHAEKESVFFNYQQAAQGGCIPAMDALGNCYYNGYGCHKNDSLAFQWYETAAHSGNTSSMCSLANCYCHGIGTEKNPKSRLYWLEKASNAGNLYAKCLLGEYYLSEVSGQAQKAADYLLPAAKKEDPDALFSLGWAIHEGAYGSGYSIESCFKKAADLGHAASKVMLLTPYTGQYYDVVSLIGDLVKCMADDEFVQRFRGDINIEAVDSTGDFYTRNYSHFNVYTWLFDADNEEDVRVFKSLLTYYQPYISRKLKLVRYYFPTTSILDNPDQYRLAYPEYIPMPDYADSEAGLDKVLTTLQKGLELYLGDGYQVSKGRARLKVSKG